MALPDIQTTLRVIYPPRCVGCGEMVESDFGLCGTCFVQMHFCGDVICDLCGAPLLGENDGEALFCDDCMAIARPWEKGRSAFVYRDLGRRLVMSFKHSDRSDILHPAALWLERAVRDMVLPDMLVVPVPLHRWRFFRRRYNQAALLGRMLARRLQLDFCPDALIRPQTEGSTEGLGLDARFAKLDGAVVPHPKQGARMKGRAVLLVDDVMTSGATLAACAEAARIAGATQIRVVTLARVVKDI